MHHQIYSYMHAYTDNIYVYIYTPSVCVPLHERIHLYSFLRRSHHNMQCPKRPSIENKMKAHVLTVSVSMSKYVTMTMNMAFDFAGGT